MKTNTVYLVLGGNQGNTFEILQKTRELINQQVGEIVKTSSIYRTPPWGFVADQDFLNQVVVIQTLLPPHLLLEKLLEIENSLGRIRQGNQYHSRTVDIDILFYEDQVIHLNNLVIPHPRIPLRKFVLVPLSEIAPEFRHPGLNLTIHELLAQCSDDASCIKL